MPTIEKFSFEIFQEPPEEFGPADTLHERFAGSAQPCPALLHYIVRDPFGGLFFKGCTKRPHTVLESELRALLGRLNELDFHHDFLHIDAAAAGRASARSRRAQRVLETFLLNCE